MTSTGGWNSGSSMFKWTTTTTPRVVESHNISSLQIRALPKWQPGKGFIPDLEHFIPRISMQRRRSPFNTKIGLYLCHLR